MTDKRPLFSVIIPVYNVIEYLPECLDSLLGQSYPNIQIIIVDDVSTDGSRDVAREYAQKFPDKILLIEHKVNTRQGGARNTGIEAATGDYLMFVDSDDYLESNALEIMADVIAKENADIVECCFSFVDEYRTYLRCSTFRDKIDRLKQHKPLLISEMGPCNKVYQAALLKDTGIRFPEKYYYEDYWTVPKILMAAKKVVYINEPLYCYRQRSSSTMHDTNIERNRDIVTGTDALIQFFKESGFSTDAGHQLESLAVEHVLLNGTLRVNTIDYTSALQNEILQYMKRQFPNYRQNPYRYRFSNREKRLLKLIEGKQWLAVNLAWYQRNRMTGNIKRLLYKLMGK